MKKILIILAFALTFAACKKCAECTETTTVTTNHPLAGYPTYSYDRFEACGDELKAIDNTQTESQITVNVTRYTTRKTIECE